MNEDKAVRYHRLRRRFTCASAAVAAALLVVLQVFGVGAWVRDVADALMAQVGAASPSAGRITAIVVVTVAVVVAVRLAVLPFTLARELVVERRYGRQTGRADERGRNDFTGVVFIMSHAVGAALVVYLTMDLVGRAWWLVSAVVFSTAGLVMTLAMPFILRYASGRVARTESTVLRARMETLAERAGLRRLRVYEWHPRGGGGSGNAALLGLGPTSSVFVSEALLQACSADELDVAMAHELAHFAYGDLWTSAAVDFVSTCLALAAAHVAVSTLGPGLGLRGVDDVAGLPLLMLAAGATWVAARPWAHAVSRAQERRADAYVFELTQNTNAFVALVKRLAGWSLAEEHPSRATVWLTFSHPPVGQRIAAAKAWQPKTGTGVPDAPTGSDATARAR